MATERTIGSQQGIIFPLLLLRPLRVLGQLWDLYYLVDPRLTTRGDMILGCVSIFIIIP